MNLQSVSQILDPFLLESMLCKNNYQIRHFFDPITKKNITKKEDTMVEFFYITDECRKCAENSDVRFYLLKLLRVEEFNHKS